MYSIGVMNINERYDNILKVKYLKSLTFVQYKSIVKDDKKKKLDTDLKGQYSLLQDFCAGVIKCDGVISRIYSLIKNETAYRGGRLFSIGSIQGIKSIFRGFLSSHTTDVDMCNCHPVILKYICKLHNISCPNLTYFIENREEILAQFEDRAIAKDAFLSSLNNENKNKKIKNDTFILFDTELKMIQQKLLNIPEYQDIINAVPSDRTYNITGASVSKIYTHYEGLLLNSVIEFMTSMGLEIFALMFDGVMVYGDLYNNTELLVNLELFIETRYEGLNMKFSYKPHNNTIKLPDDFTELVAINNELNDIYDTIQSMTNDIGIINYIMLSEPDKFMWIKKELYCWTGSKWEQSQFEFVRYINKTLLPFIEEVQEKAVRVKNGLLIFACRDVIKKIANNTGINNIVRLSECLLTRDDIKFDENKDLLGFDNGVYELLTDVFRPYRYDDYVTMSCGYDYNPNVDKSLLDELEGVFTKIMPVKEKRTLFFQILSAGLTGHCIEKFIIFNGGGRNGKGLTNEFMKIILGDYGYVYANVSLLTEKDKTGANPEKSKLHNKRYVVMKEPSQDRLRNDRIKDITGGGNLSGRDLYKGKNDCEITLSQILVLECNVRALLVDAPTYAEVERIVDVDFTSSFTSNDDDVNDVTVFKGDLKYKTPEWKLKHRDAFLQMILVAFKKFRSNNYTFDIPFYTKQRSLKYLEMSMPILQMFNTVCVKTETKDAFVKIKDVVNNIVYTEAYKLLDNRSKSKYSKEFIKDYLKTDPLFKGSYRARKQTDIIDVRNILMGFNLINNDDEDEDDENL